MGLSPHRAESSAERCSILHALHPTWALTGTPQLLTNRKEASGSARLSTGIPGAGQGAGRWVWGASGGVGMGAQGGRDATRSMSGSSPRTSWVSGEPSQQKTLMRAKGLALKFKCLCTVSINCFARTVIQIGFSRPRGFDVVNENMKGD